MRRIRAALVAALAALLPAGCTATGSLPDHSAAAPPPAPAPAAARNVILFIGDGMGDSEITIARNYAVGAAGRLAMDGLEFTGSYTTYSVHRGTKDSPDYVTDSAAAATGWATGHKSYNGAVSVDPVTLEPMPTLLEKARDAGYRTGNVTTAELTDATPAAQESHVSYRGCQGPADMTGCPDETIEAGGAGSVAEQAVRGGFDVLLGGGKSRFDQVSTSGPAAGQTVLAQARDSGYQVVTDLDELDAARPGRRVLGLFAPADLDPQWSGPAAAPYPGPPATTCTDPDPARSADQPQLAEMTTKAISLLSAPDGTQPAPGFLLQVEGALIDKEDHAANTCAQIGETIAFDRAVQVGLDWSRDHPDTLIVVTGDHGQASQILPPQTDSDHGPGVIATLITADGQQMVVSYATNLAGRPMNHTGTQIRIAARGPHAEKVLGLTDQTDLHGTLARALGLD